MNPRIGRPTDNPRTNRMEVRLNKDEKQIIDSIAEKANTTKTDILICGINLLDFLTEHGEINDLIDALLIRRDVLRCTNKEEYPLKKEDGIVNSNQIKIELLNLLSEKIS